jgi:PAS domain S-box-containing protein
VSDLSEEPPRNSAPRALRVSVPALLSFLSLAVLLPIIGFSLYSLSQFTKSQRTIDEQLISNRAVGVSSNIDRDINGLISTAAALSSSQSLVEGSFGAFYSEATRSMKYARANVLLLDLTLNQLVNTRVPFGTVLPKSSAPAETLQVVESKSFYVSDVFYGKIAKSLVFNVTMPVIVDGQVRYILLVTAEPSRLNVLLDEQELIEGRQVSVSDRTGKVFASTDRTIIGTNNSSSNIAKGTSLRAEKKSSLTGWTTTSWVSNAALDASNNKIWRGFYGVAVLAIALTILLANLLARPFANLIRQTLNSVVDIGKTGSLKPISSFLSEGAEIQSALEAANTQLRERQRDVEERSALLRTLLDGIPEGITIVGGADLRVIANSKKALEWIGKDEQQLKVSADEHAEAFGVWFPDGLTQPTTEQLPLYRASRLGEAIEGEYFLIKRPDGSQITIEVSVNPIRTHEGEIIGAISCWRDVTQRMVTDKIIADNQRRLTLALSVAGMAILDLNIEDKTITALTNGKAIFGFEVNEGERLESAMERFISVLHPDDRKKLEDRQREALQQVGTFVDEFRVLRPGGPEIWIETRAETLAGESGKPVRLLGTNVDITARKRAEEHLLLVSRELTHRAKNLLMIIQAIATQTARRNSTVQDFLDAFSRRIGGLAASHDLLVNTDWKGVQLADLVHSQLQAFGGVDGKRIKANGPPILLKTDTLQSLGLALHELATNASKYGALSSAKGTVDISWSVTPAEDGAHFSMAWIERGGPKVKPPSRKGFGHVVIESSLARVVNGEVHLVFEPKGIKWTVEAPFSAVAIH